MVDRSLVRDLRRWATEEFNLPPDSLPNDGHFKTWALHRDREVNMEICHPTCFSTEECQDHAWQSAVLKQTEGQSEAAKQKDLQRQIEQLKSEISHLDSQISGTEEQLATQGEFLSVSERTTVLSNRKPTLVLFYSSPTEQSVSRTWAQVEDSRRRELVLQAFRQRCIVGRQELSDDTQKISGHCQTLEQMSSSDGDNLNSKAAAEAQVLREVRELCDCRVRFYQSLQDSELKTTKHMTREQRTAVFQYWLSAVEYLASREQGELEEKLSALNVMRDVTNLKVQLIQNQLQVRRREAEQEVSALEVELQVVMQAAARDHIRERCIQLDQQARSRQEALQSLHSQWQSILDFRQLVVLRQEDIRGLIKGNSTAKTELIRLHRELQQFVLSTLVPQFEVVSSAASIQRNCISKEARQLGTISLPALDRRTTGDRESLHRGCPSIACRPRPSAAWAPEELCSQARSQQLELRFLRQLLQLHSATLQNIQKEAELLHAPDQKALLSRVMEEDQKLLECLVPRVRGLTQRSARGLSYGVQVKTAISYWWDQPAQHVLPEVQNRGMTFQQWLQRWRLAAKAS
ncbi:hypothetical protein F7725_027284 [Dissostichus mawsoni]|uniref:HAUS augmin-like complex subunit 5 n=1 Tax=Dissostichus mawsoni TaxID=36200 RepID=A0A7J5XCG4_DISMA|nr:hypothetical protein F7725_027284 [Dissostichus mawsoni]